MIVLQIKIDDGYDNIVKCASELCCFKLISSINRPGNLLSAVVNESYFIPVHLFLLFLFVLVQRLTDYIILQNAQVVNRTKQNITLQFYLT